MANTKTASMEYEKVIEYIYQMIKSGNLTVGSRIPSERDLSDMLGIGRNSTREAISILRGMGMIESVHGSGNYISTNCGHTIWAILSVMFSLGSISLQDIMQCRKVLAKCVIELLFQNGLNKDNLDYLSNVLSEMEQSNDPQELIALDHEFHRTLIKATQNSLFITVLDAISQIYGESTKLIFEHAGYRDKEKFIRLHKNIYTALAASEKELCLKHLALHYEEAESYL